MIPLTVFASRPVTGCTCASGEYKFFCVTHVSRGTAGHDPNRNAHQSEKVCCQQQAEGAHSAVCCKSGHCPLSDGLGKDSGNKCCNPDTLMAVTVASSVTFSVDNDHHELFDLPVIELGSIVADLAVLHFIPHETGPPGGDLVISLRRLLV